jgi:hypothetical protein
MSVHLDSLDEEGDITVQVAVHEALQIRHLNTRSQNYDMTRRQHIGKRGNRRVSMRE